MIEPAPQPKRAPMELKVNGEALRLERESVSVGELLVLNAVESPEMVAVQVNGGLVERDAHGTTLLADGDEVDFLYFMGGGR